MKIWIAVLITLLAVPLDAWCQSQDSKKCLECHNPAHDSKVTTTDHAVHMKARISCQTCHGDDDVDPVAVPAHSFKDGFRGRAWDLHFPTFCRTCHTTQADFFERGKHGEATRGGKIRGCVECHNFRGTEPLVHAEAPRHRNLREYCLRCHKEGTAGSLVGTTFRDLFDKQADGAGRVQARLDMLSSTPGVDVSDETDRMTEAHAGFQRMRSAQHSMLIDEVVTLARDVSKQQTSSEMSLERKESALGRRVVWLIAFLLLLALTAGVIFIKFRRIIKSEREKTS